MSHINKSFKEDYARYYDAFYQDKDYEAECDFIEQVFKKFSENKPKKVLDIGCGTGGHAIPLARRGYDVTGIDRSGEMIKIARQKAKESGVNVNFCVQDMRQLRLNRKFDAAISMFAVLDYLVTSHDVQKTLVSIRKHLCASSLFVFDFWNGLAVLSIRPENRIKIVEHVGEEIIRFVTPKLDPIRQTCENTYYCLIKKRDRVIGEFKETHVVRFYFPEEITHCLEENGFKVLGLYPFMDLRRGLDEKTWNLTAITRAK